jgi:nitrate reductase gamma subunit
MALITAISIYAGLGFFIAGSLWRAIQYSRMPVHLRWELYPVPGEGAKRAAHGGSYFEESNWWKYPRRAHPFNELKAMLGEIFMLRGIWKLNQGLWWLSYPFHIGLYFLVTGCFLSILGVSTARFSPAYALYLAAHICAWFGLSLTLVGSVGLFLRRVFDKELRNYTVPGDLFNVGGFALVCALILAGAITGTMPPFKDAVYGLLTLHKGLHLPLLLNLGLILGSAMTGYIPFTHMAHYIAKYFTYHCVRWDDARRTESMEIRIAQCLAYHPTWSAAHVGGETKNSWAEITQPARSAQRGSQDE